MQVYNPNDNQYNNIQTEMNSEKQVDVMEQGFESGYMSGNTTEYNIPKSVYDNQSHKEEFGINHFIRCILFIVLFFVVFFARTDADEYLERGTPVTATITHVEYGVRRSYTVYGTCEDMYVFPSNVKILNAGSKIPGTVVNGYYLPEKPGQIWCKPTAGTEMLLKVLAVIFGLAGVVGLIRAFKS